MGVLELLLPNLKERDNIVRDAWVRMRSLPGGKRAFSRLVGSGAPYTGSIGAQVVDLRVGYAEVCLPDRRRVRNHLGCIHAAALANLAEMTAGLAIAYSLPSDSRFIPTGLSIEYKHKARGPVTAMSESPLPATAQRTEYGVPVRILDSSGTEVAHSTLRILVGPARGSAGSNP